MCALCVLLGFWYQFLESEHANFRNLGLILSVIAKECVITVIVAAITTNQQSLSGIMYYVTIVLCKPSNLKRNSCFLQPSCNQSYIIYTCSHVLAS